MNQRLRVTFATLGAIFAMSLSASAAVNVSSVEALSTNLKKSNVELTMSAGAYNIATPLTIEGSNNSYDFSDVKFEGEGQINITGSGNTIKNLGLTGVTIVMDGANNTVEGVSSTTTIVVRGDMNKVKGCIVTLRDSSHAISIEGAKGATIEGCTIEGEMYESEGYTLSKVGDGIRTAATGDTVVGGEKFTARKTGGKIIIVGCTVKYTRGGINVALGEGSRHIERCTLVGCQEGYSANNGAMIVNCKADSAFGPALWIDDAMATNFTADITLMPYAGEKRAGNKSGHAMFIQGMGHKIVIKQSDALTLEAGQSIAIGGDCKTMAYRAKVDNMPAANMVITNESGYAVIIGENTSYNTIITGGDVDGNTYDNTIEDL